MQACFSKIQTILKKVEKKVSGSCGGWFSESHFLYYFVPVVITVTTAANSLVKKGSSYFHKGNFILFNYLESLLSFLGFNDPRM